MSPEAPTSAGGSEKTAADSERTAVGIDVGGTKIAAGVVSETGRILARRALPTLPERGGEPILADVLRLARELAAEGARLGSPPSAIGLGLCELVDPEGGIRSEHTVRWRGWPVAARLAEILPARLEADVRAAALCEARLGAGKAFPALLYVTIGTGISCCLVLDGVPHAGALGCAGTMATSPTVILCPRCGEIASASLEDIASGPALARRHGHARAEDVLEALQRGDPTAGRVVATASECIGAAIGQLINVLDPHGVVTGGGLGSAGGPYWRGLEAATRRHIWADIRREIPIARASFGQDAGMVGAAIAAIKPLSPRLQRNAT